MVPKRYIAFGRPPTIQQLRAVTDVSPQASWKTRKISLQPQTPSSSRHQATELKIEKRDDLIDDRNPCPDQLSASISSLKSEATTFKRPYPEFVADHESQEVPSEVTTMAESRTKAPRASNPGSANPSSKRDHELPIESDSMDYYQSQLDYRDSFAEMSQDASLMLTPGVGCLLPPSQCSPIDPSPSSTSRQASQNQTTYSESVVVNPPQWHFDARSCTPLDQLIPSSGTLYSILFHLSAKKPMITIHLKKRRKNGSTTANLAHFECLDDSGSSLKLALWDDVAEELDSVCFLGDIIYLSGIAISSYQDHFEGGSTPGTRAQICYRLRPTHSSHLHMFCPDMRLGYDPTTQRVKELVDWARH